MRRFLPLLSLFSTSLPTTPAILASQMPESCADVASSSRPVFPSQPSLLPPPSSLVPASDLHCIELVPTPDLTDATGVAELRRIATPFGTAVSPDGQHLYGLVLSLGGLPSPSSLGAYSTYVAWVTTPQLSPIMKLGTVQNGRTELGQVGFNKFVVMVSAEVSPHVRTRQGRLVLRGNSPSALMLPHGTSMLPPRLPSLGGEHRHGAGEWSMPPMHPAVQTMIPGLEELRPKTAPFLPGSGVEPSSLQEARPRQVLKLQDGDSISLEAVLVRRTINGRTFTMYGFNGQYPGPLITVPRDATIVVNFANRIDLPTTVHWHGVRLDNRFDGVPHVTQDPVPPGGSFRYVVRFPDAGIYWYHPHHREDIQQEMGLYGNLMVKSPRANYYSAVNREEVLILDDLLLAEDGPVAFGRESATHALMGRFGNVFLVNGDPRYRLKVNRGEVVRFFFTNVSNTRTFNLSLGRVRMKVVGSDVSNFEREEWVRSVVIAPAERYIVEARFDRAGKVAFTNRVQAIDHTAGTFFAEVDTLGEIAIARTAAKPDYSAAFSRLRVNGDVVADIDRYRSHFDRPVDHQLLLTLAAKDIPFGLQQIMRLDTAYVNPVEWSGTMPMMDWLTTGGDVQWIIRDLATGRENMAIDWRFGVGDVVKIRLVNDRHTLHAMQHPIHIHGQRFLVLALNGVPNTNLAWKDTALLPAGSTADILLELSNPGRWMLHCHIAEHLEAGMHMVFTVEPERGKRKTEGGMR